MHYEGTHIIYLLRNQCHTMYLLFFSKKKKKID